MKTPNIPKIMFYSTFFKLATQNEEKSDMFNLISRLIASESLPV